jgi:methyl-accepting chemotaxis protein
MEKRRYPRRNVDRPAKMFIPEGGSLPCRIRDVSRGGAKLTFAWKGWLPRGFDLQDAFTGVRRAAQIVWSGVNGIGVRFTRTKPAGPNGPDLAVGDASPLHAHSQLVRLL